MYTDRVIVKERDPHLRGRIHDLLTLYPEMTTYELAQTLGKTTQVVSYHRKLLGLGKSRSHSGRCCVCKTGQAEKSLNYAVCRSPLCTMILLQTIQCQPREEDAALMLIEHGIKVKGNIPPNAVICTRGHKHRIYHDLRDHVKYHAYDYEKPHWKSRKSSPPTPLYTFNEYGSLVKNSVKT